MFCYASGICKGKNIMVNNGRIYAVSAAVSRQALIERLVKGRVPLCSGLYHSGLLFLNDSNSEEGEKRFAVMKVDGFPQPGRWELNQLDTLRIAGRDAAELLEIVNNFNEEKQASRVIVQIDGPGHVCPLCA